MFQPTRNDTDTIGDWLLLKKMYYRYPGFCTNECPDAAGQKQTIG